MQANTAREVVMKYFLILLSVGCLAFCIGDVVDIKGYFYYISDDVYWYHFSTDSAEARFSVPVDSGKVSLYKRNDSSGWDQYGSSVYSDQGYYVFEDIDTGSDSSDLCTNSNWFRIEFDATGHLPVGWDNPRVQDRFSTNSVRPAGIVLL